MSPLSRKEAVDLAHQFLRSQIGRNTWIGVFSLSKRLNVIQTYTSDAALLSQAVNRAGTGAFEQFAHENLQLIEQLNSLGAHGTGGPGLSGSSQTSGSASNARRSGGRGSGGGASSGGNQAEAFRPLDPGSAEERGPQNDAWLAAANGRIIQLTLSALFSQEGMRSMDALRQLVRSQSTLPGRKTILLFSEGLVIPPNEPELLDHVIQEANRANVSFYTVDARGLTPVSNLRLSALTNSAIGQAELGTAPSVLPTDTQANARRLAEHTGGFAMDNSNDLRAPLARVMEEIRSHYEVTYSPTNKSLNGRFRKMQVLVKRKGIAVQNRPGYYDLP